VRLASGVMHYYEGNPPEVVRHGSPWPDAKFVWVKDAIGVSPGVFPVPVALRP